LPIPDEGTYVESNNVFFCICHWRVLFSFLFFNGFLATEVRGKFEDINCVVVGCGLALKSKKKPTKPHDTTAILASKGCSWLIYF